MVQAWDPAHTSGDITLSGSNLIATKTANSGSDSQAYAIESVTTGRYYWELIPVGSISSGGGIGNITSSIGSYLGGLSSSFGWFGNGQVITNNAQVATWAAYASGNTIAFAMDLVSNKLWGRVGAAGNWNNDVIGNQNPDFGSQVGGFAIPAGVTAAAVVPGANMLTTSSDFVTGVFASASWIGTPPSGFGAFDPVAATMAWPRPAVSF
jgi:hypothetical protein